MDFLIWKKLAKYVFYCSKIRTRAVMLLASLLFTANHVLLANHKIEVPLPLERHAMQNQYWNHARFYTFRHSHALPPLLMELLPLARLTSILSPSPTSISFLRTLHARTQRNVHPRRGAEPKASCQFDQVQLLNVKHASQTVRRVCIEVGAVAFLGRLVEVVVARDELFELGLDVEDLFGGEVEFDEGH